MTVYKRGKKGVFYMNFTVNGVRVFRSTDKYTKKEAKHVEALERQKVIDQAKMAPKERAAKMLLEDAIDHVYEARWKSSKDAYGARNRSDRLLEHVGNIPLEAIDEAVCHKLILTLEKNKNKPATINRYLACLKTILRHMKQPFDFIKLRKERSGRIRVLTREEEKAVVALLRETKHSDRRSFYPEVADLVEVLVDTGMRLSEMLDLQYDDVDFQANLINIWINKGDRPRSVPMTNRVKRILESRKKDDVTKPFTVTVYQADKAWDWARKEMGLKDDKEFVVHALRHTCASRLVNRGIDLYVVKEWLGHADISTTQKYAHLSPKKLAHAAAVLE